MTNPPLPSPRTGPVVPDRFAGKTAIVTGASRGIGLGIARRLLAEGASVVITARGQEGLDAALAELDAPSRVVAVAGKSDDDEHRAATVARAEQEFGPVDLLVNNTGINPVFGRTIDIDLDAARKIAEVNNLATLAWTQKVYHSGLGERGGAVVNVASIAGLAPSPGIGWYGATKALVMRLTQELAVEVGPAVRVNAVAPGVVKTKFAEALYSGREEAMSAALPTGRLGVPDDIAGPVSFLLSDDAHWITGQTLVVDGGAHMVGAGLQG
ncbi:3-oxoacyl-ACP reductase [Dietzia sp. NCCP-2495]|uniref:SDR family oxidoreductase n=1 Tax=Dietzia sp. NCCP-2495 TaxID=2934675 RepID=UPI0022316451|nr:SDR family oxidoreductase [Dietzia sp. NCCP-2495]GLB64879.1 3-oxoacyl-ACP reductase [Dietzia sp. NCCP-2495]